jgi:tRNA(fMet)-specific endonuclease VapC
VRLLLDTNAYAALFRGNEAVAARVRRAEQVLISAIVAGELLFGFRNGSRYEANAGRLDDFLASPYVTFLPVTRVTADRFARIAASLRRKGRPLPSNDIWIAAHAMESGADLLSFDEHFAHVDGLAWIRPAVGE